MLFFLSCSYFSLLGIVFILSLVVYIRKGVPLYLKLFPPFLLLTIIVEIIGRVLGQKYGANQGYYSFFAIVEFIFYFIVLERIIHFSPIKRIIQLATWVYPIIALINIFFIQGCQLDVFATYGIMLGSILIVLFCIYYFYSMLRMTQYLN